MGGTLLDIQGILGQDHPGIIGVEMVAGKEGDAAEVDAHVAFADPFTCGSDGDGGQRLDTDIQIFQIVNLTHCAIDDQPFPLVLYGQTRQVSVNQCASNGTTAVNQHDMATAVLFEHIVEQPVILETFYRDDLSTKRRAPSKVGEQRLHDVDILLVDVTKLGSIVFHRLNVQLLREFSVYLVNHAVGKIINC